MPTSTDVTPFIRFYSSSSSPPHLRCPPAPPLRPFCLMSATSSLLRSLFPALRAACSWLGGPTLALITLPSSSSRRRRRRLTVTFFGHRKGRISFAVQETPRSDPLLLLDLATPTSHLIKEMSSGMVRILLESEHSSADKTKKRALWEEPVWSMYCNGQRCGYAVARACTAADARLLRSVSAVSVGAGLMSVAVTALPSTDGGDQACFSRSGSRSGGESVDEELMYMRARFERVAGSKDSEALYMMNPDAGGRGTRGADICAGHELSIFLLRV